MKILVVLPTYNEAPNVPKVLRQIRDTVPDADVLVIDDASPDGTGRIARSLAEELGRIQVLSRDGKHGLGSAYREGFRHGLRHGYHAIVEMDADLSHDPSALPALLAALEQGADLSIGTRYMPGGAVVGWAAHRRAISYAGNLYARGLLGVRARDATSGFRAFHRRALEGVDLEAVRAEGYGFQIELVYMVERAGGTIAEVPIVFVERALGHSKMSLRIVFEAFVLVTLWGLKDRVRRARGRADSPVLNPRDERAPGGEALSR